MLCLCSFAVLMSLSLCYLSRALWYFFPSKCYNLTFEGMAYNVHVIFWAVLYLLSLNSALFSLLGHFLVACNYFIDSSTSVNLHVCYDQSAVIIISLPSKSAELGGNPDCKLTQPDTAPPLTTSGKLAHTVSQSWKKKTDVTAVWWSHV